MFALATPALAGVGIAADAYVIGWALIGLTLITLFVAFTFLNNARAFTECSPAGLRTRTAFGRLRERPWPHVANISVKVFKGRGGEFRRVIVMTTDGHRIRLAAPTFGVLTPEEFTASAQQIQDYWRAALAGPGRAGRP